VTILEPMIYCVTALPLAAYLALCLLVGLVARGTWLGFFGFFVLSFVVTPLISALILLLAARRQATPRELGLERELERVLLENEELKRRLAGGRPRRFWQLGR
jgi:hypothetical protein